MTVELLEKIEIDNVKSYVFNLKNVPRFVLQELARHRVASYSVKSSRYTLMKEFKNEKYFITLSDKGYFQIKDGAIERAKKYIDLSNNPDLHLSQLIQLDQLLNGAKYICKNSDELKYLLPETWLCDIMFTIDGHSLQNFLNLRTSGSAHFRIQDLANLIKDAVNESL